MCHTHQNAHLLVLCNFWHYICHGNVMLQQLFFTQYHVFWELRLPYRMVRVHCSCTDLHCCFVLQLTEFLSDQNELAAADVLVFIREAIQRFENLRPLVVDKLLETFPMIKALKWVFWKEEKPLFFLKAVLTYLLIDRNLMWWIRLYCDLMLSCGCGKVFTSSFPSGWIGLWIWAYRMWMISGFIGQHCGFWVNTAQQQRTYRMWWLWSDSLWVMWVSSAFQEGECCQSFLIVREGTTGLCFTS